MLLKKVTIILIVMFGIAGCLDKPRPRSGDFNGKVIDSLTKEPVPGVTVIMNGNKVVTDIGGKFFIEVLPPGEYDISMARVWYYPKTGHLKHVGRTDLWTFTLKSEPINGKILYSGDRDGKREIYELNLSDRNITRLTFLPNSSESNPVRLDSDKIIFQSDMVSGDYHKNDLFIYNIKTQQSERICSVDKINDEHPSLKSKTAQKLIFKSMRNGEGQIFLYQIDSGQPEVSLNIKGEYPVINPDPLDSRIAYVNGSDQLCIYDSSQPLKDKINPRVINLPNRVGNPCWSPDGKKIAVDSWSDSSTTGRYIYIIEPETSASHQITYSYSFNDNHRHPCWSSDGKYIFFTGTIVYSSRMDIYCVRLNEDGLTTPVNGLWLMVSGGPGSKDYPSWGEED